MKRALILHGTGASSVSNWFPWLKQELMDRGLGVWTPDLPGSGTPNIARYTRYITDNDFKIDEDTLVIGHSSGAVAALGLAQAIDGRLGGVMAVSAFTHDLGWESLTELFDPPLDDSSIRSGAQKIIFVHAKDDPYCPVDEARALSSRLGAAFELLDAGGHFSYELDPKWSSFPDLVTLLDKYGLI